MRKLILLIFITTLNQLNAQQLDGYKYVNVQKVKYEEGPVDKFGLYDTYSTAFKINGLIPVSENDINKLVERGDYCKLLRVFINSEVINVSYYTRVKTTLTFVNCKNESITTASAKSGSDMSSIERDAKNSGIRAINSITKNYKYNPNLTPIFESLGFDFSKIDTELDGTSEASIRNYFDKKGIKNIEGIWGSTSMGSSYKLAIFYSDYKYFVTIVEGVGLWNTGELKATMEEAAVDEVLTIKWKSGSKTDETTTTGIFKDNAIIEFDLPYLETPSTLLYKIYPKISKTKKSIKNDGWAGNGSGIIISKSGYIVTNHHVVEDADDIEVEFIANGEVQKFNAEVIQLDKINDLAIIKIFDMDFDGVDDLPYNFKTRSSDVGTKVYAFGYPMALSVMGKEIKITDGIISSKSGYDGNITTYQITAPIQGGNSGGPLFDENGNFIGINSSGLGADVANNVAYTIKSSYVLNLIDVLPKSIDLPSSTKLQSLPLTEQIKEISKYVVLVKVK